MRRSFVAKGLLKVLEVKSSQFLLLRELRHVMHLSMLNPSGGRAYMGHLTSTAFRTPKIWAPGWGHLLFLHGGKGRLFSMEVSTSFYIYWKPLLLTAHFQYYLKEHLTLWDCVDCWWYQDSLFARESSVGSLLKIFFIHWLGGGYLIRFDQILGPQGGAFDQKFFWKVKCPTYTTIQILLYYIGFYLGCLNCNVFSQL